MANFREIIDYALTIKISNLKTLGYSVDDDLDQNCEIMQAYFFSDDNFDGLFEYCEEFTKEVFDSIYVMLFQGITVELEASHSGEREGEDYYHVYKFTLDSTGEEEYVKFQGQLDSYSGQEYLGYGYVKPIERLVKFYE